MCVCDCVLYSYISLAELKEMLRTNGIDYYTDDQIQQMVSTRTGLLTLAPVCSHIGNAHSLMLLLLCSTCRLWLWTVRRSMRKASASSPSHVS